MDTCPTCASPFGKRRRCYVCKPGKKRSKETRQCQSCGVSFAVSPSRIAASSSGGVFCSRSCSAGRPRPKTAARETRPCAACGKPITKLVSQIHGDQWFCNRECQRPFRPQGASASKEPNPYRGQKETRPCVQCGTPVTRYLTPERINSRWTCSYKCMGKEQSLRLDERGIVMRPNKPRTGDTVPCSVCGKEFYRQPAYIKQGRHLCSIACNTIWQRRNRSTKTCPVCQTEFIIKPSQARVTHCSMACQSKARTKRDTGRVHNGRPVIKNAAGYLTVYEPTNPNASKSGRVLEHRYVIGQMIGRYLETEEQVHHINHDPTDNRPKNLEIMNPGDHTRETVSHTQKRHMDVAEELAAYRKRFGPLE